MRRLVSTVAVIGLLCLSACGTNGEQKAFLQGVYDGNVFEMCAQVDAQGIDALATEGAIRAQAERPELNITPKVAADYLHNVCG